MEHYIPARHDVQPLGSPEHREGQPLGSPEHREGQPLGSPEHREGQPFLLGLTGPRPAVRIAR
jgi:hypothetical protein